MLWDSLSVKRLQSFIISPIMYNQEKEQSQRQRKVQVEAQAALSPGK